MRKMGAGEEVGRLKTHTVLEVQGIFTIQPLGFSLQENWSVPGSADGAHDNDPDGPMAGDRKRGEFLPGEFALEGEGGWGQNGGVMAMAWTARVGGEG